jgi:diadenosine tetraphosphate (Ap4A) HIT family hydrolase
MVSMPCRWSSWDNNKPEGPAPIMPTCVRMITILFLQERNFQNLVPVVLWSVASSNRVISDMNFQVDTILARDTSEVIKFELSHVLLLNDARFPWIVLVPVRAGLREIHDLCTKDQLVLMGEITRVSSVLSDLYKPDKINIGALGNIVSQLHIHIIARFKDDPAWPGPVWGHGHSQLYEAGALAKTKADLLSALGREMVE